MELEEIRLERSVEHPNQTVIVGLNGDIEIDERIAQAVDRSGRLFSYVVRHVAINRAVEAGVGFSDESPEPLHEHMRNVRDELKLSVTSLRANRRQARLDQAYNLTANVKPERPPYFAR